MELAGFLFTCILGILASTILIKTGVFTAKGDEYEFDQCYELSTLYLLKIGLYIIYMGFCIYLVGLGIRSFFGI